MSTETIPQRNEIKNGDTWNLSPLFEQDKQWNNLYDELEQKLPRYNDYKGKLHESLDIFRNALEFDLEMSRSLEKLYVFAHLKNDEDKSNQLFAGMYQKAMNLYTRISELSSFLTPEIQSIPDEIMNTYIKDDSMKDYTFYLERIVRFKPHTLSNEIEQILAMSGEVAHAPSQIFSELDNADLTFGLLEIEEGKKIELSHGNFNSMLMHQSRDIRKKAFHQYYKTYEDHKHTIAATLDSSNKKDVFFSKVRKFPSSIESALFSDNVSMNVYENLLSTVKNNLSPLFTYLDFRKKTLGLDELHFYDTYVPLVKEVDFHMPYEEAVEVCVESLQVLGDEYTSILREGLLNGWVDRYENKGKRSGAYSSGCYDSPPYILMNYKEDNINSLYTLIHEAGHSMHSYYSVKHQPYVSHDYTIFVAEVASTFNETLLGKFLLQRYKDDPKMKAYIINREIDNIRGTLYRQTMFAEFEKISHALVEKNEPLTLDKLRISYNELLKIYFGDSMTIDEDLTLECLRIPHFYSAFYVYKYATGISAAIALADKVLNEGDSARDEYLNFLKLGGSMFPIDELKTAGVDMNRPEPVEHAIKHFKGLVDELMGIL